MHTFKEILRILAIAVPLYALVAFAVVCAWHAIMKRRGNTTIDGIQVSSDGGKTWTFIPHDSVREGWVLDPTTVSPDPHSPMCDIRKGNRCSCGSRRGAYMN